MIVAGTRLGPVDHSSIVDLRVVPDLKADLVGALRAIMAEHPGEVHILLGSVDRWVRELVANREELAPAIIPYASKETIDRITNKAEFARICVELDIPHPRTVVLRPAGEIPDDLPSPMVVKAAVSAEFDDVEFEGKNKVEFFDDRKELRNYFARVLRAGYNGEFVVQEFVLGGDDAMGAVNAFYGPDGAAHFFVFGQVLLEERTPGGLGNSVGQITGSTPDHRAVRDARRLLDHIGWVGFANIDLKIAEGQYLFFELNPRVGRSGYAVTAAGFNAAEYYVRAFADGQPGPLAPEVAERAHLFTVVPTRMLARYAPRWAGRIRELRSADAVTNPYYYRPERNPRRWFYIAAAMVNQYRKFARHHPGPP